MKDEFGVEKEHIDNWHIPQSLFSLSLSSPVSYQVLSIMLKPSPCSIFVMLSLACLDYFKTLLYFSPQLAPTNLFSIPRVNYFKAKHTGWRTLEGLIPLLSQLSASSLAFPLHKLYDEH